MKIPYSPDLYKKIVSRNINKSASFIDENGDENTIFIRNLTQLSKNDLDLLMPEGVDKFSKMVMIYNKYSKGGNENVKSKKEIDAYIKIYRENRFSMLSDVNQYISDNKLWRKFPTIRSLNDHGHHKNIRGIQPKYFRIVCEKLGITEHGGGERLTDYKKY